MRYILFFLLVLFTSNIFAAGERFVIIPFSSSDTGTASQITSKCISSTPFEMKSIDPNIQIPPVPADGISSEKYISDMAGIARKSGADFCLTGSIEQRNDTISIFAIVINAKNNTIAYKTLLSVDAKNKKYDPSIDIWGRIKNNLEGTSYPVKNLSASKGLFNTEVALNWDPVPEASEYAVYRSNSVNGTYDFIAFSKQPTFMDKKAIPGIKYFYMISPRINGVIADPSTSIDGYKKPIPPKGEDLRALLGSYKKSRPRLSGDDAKNADQQIAVIRPFYQNRTKLNMAIYMVRDYVNKKELIVLKKFKEYTVNRDTHVISLTPEDNSFTAFFSNNTFFSKIVGLGDDELTDRLLRNAVFFCVYNGVKETTLENGNTAFIPEYEAITMCTQYFSEPADWQDTTLVFGTSNKELKAKIEEERRKRDRPPGAVQ